MKYMKRTFVKMMLLAVLSAIAGQSWADDAKPQINPGKYTGGSMIFRGETNGSIDFSEQIYEADPGATVYILTQANSTHSLNGIQWHVVKSGPSSQAQSRAESAGYAAEIVVTQIDLTTYKFSMPQDGSNVTVNAVFPDKPSAKVSYFDPTAAPGEQEKTHVAYILEGTETGLGVEGKETWYYCPPATDANDGAGFTYARALNTYGDIHLILADGCKMSVGTADSRINDNAFSCYRGSLVIYGQTAGSGTLSAYSNTNAIFNRFGPLTINGGTVIANGTDAGLATSDSPLTINGGTIDATATNGNGIQTDNANIAILGGKVSATGKGNGVSSGNSDIILGWRHPSDYIYAKGYSCGNGNVKTVDGKRFVAVGSENKASVIFGTTSGSGETALPNDIYLTNADAEKTIAGKTLMPIAVAETDAQGATTFSPGFLLSVTASGITPVGRTEPDFTLGTTPYYIYKAGGDGVTIPVSVKNYGQTGADFSVSIDGAADTSLPDAAVTVSGGLATAALPWTGANDVELKSARYYCTGVKYLDWNYTTKQLVPATTYVDTVTDPNDPSANSPAPGNTIKVYILTGGTGADLPDGWYVVKNWNTDESNNSGIDAFYTSPVKFTGDTRLILADGARMDIGTSTTPSNGECIHIEPGSLSIYAQSTDSDMGELNAYAVKWNKCIYSYNTSSASCITINGGKITCSVNTGCGIYSESLYSNASVVINGGTIDCSGSNTVGLYTASVKSASTIEINDGTLNLHDCSYGIYVDAGDDAACSSTLAIKGGKVKDTSDNGFGANSSSGVGDLILGWMNLDDYIYATKYYAGVSISTVSGQYLMACSDADGSGSAYNGTLDATAVGNIEGKYLRPAIYTISAPENCNLSVADNIGTVDPVILGSGDAAKTYYLYDPDNTVTASLKNESFVTNYLIKNTGDNPVNVNIVGVGSASGVEGVNAVSFTMTDQDLKIVNNGLRLPTTGGKYLAFVDNNANVTTDITRTTILVFLGLEKNPTTGVIEARFTEVSEVPKDLPVIFAKADGVSNLPATIGVDEDNSASANALAATIRADASPLFMTGTAGQTVADVLTAALSGTTLSQNAGDYVFFLFDGTQFIAVNTSATSTLSGRRYLLAVDKLQLLRFLNDNGSAAVRSQSATAPARRLSATDGVWAFPLILGGDDATGIKSMDNGKWIMDNGDWYTIDGRKMNGRPAQKGVYIRNGQKVVIK